MRKPINSIGEITIGFSDKEFFFKPSFINISSIGEPKEIVEIYASVHGMSAHHALQTAYNTYGNLPAFVIKCVAKPAYGKEVLTAAAIIMQACCDDDITALTGYWTITPRGVKYIKGIMPINDIIVIARRLIEHGVIGMTKLRIPQRDQQHSNFASEFKVMDYISMARAQFNMSREEAENLSMTEFQDLIKARFPEKKGFTAEEYDKIYDDYFKKREQKIAKANAAKKAKEALLNGK